MRFMVAGVGVLGLREVAVWRGDGVKRCRWGIGG